MPLARRRCWRWRAGLVSTFASCIPTYLYATLLAGTYTTPAIYAEVKAGGLNDAAAVTAVHQRRTGAAY